MNNSEDTIVTNNNSVADNIPSSVVVYGRHEFLQTRPELAVPCIIVLGIASIVGTLGNLLILFVVATKRKLRNVESIFIVNLAISDLYVTVVADPMSLIAKLEGEEFFGSVPGLCKTVASICTISCVTSMMTIAVMSLNRYVYICANDIYNKIFTKKTCCAISLSVYSVGIILVLMNTVGFGDHGFDQKSLECIWNRMETFPFTIIFSVILVWIPSLITGLCYLRIYIYVRKHRRRIQEHTSQSYSSDGPLKSFRLAKTLFLIYAVFVSCWTPYALLIVIDSKDTFSHEVHLYITMFAHMHPSMNWCIYFITNTHFAKAYKEVFEKFLSCEKRTKTRVHRIEIHQVKVNEAIRHS
ncbi:MTR1A-like protein [Mya arenaria]|uniref:MTR1A-like protein n=1 Tax=Mya arenaria TaxID=6604 RepID=A0ABY7FXF4_MYAAR|nr:melatonin receptor type 1B-A-like [Mya arenaria]WAR25824.1 MTR1A-like protein [Mya arenaria]